MPATALRSGYTDLTVLIRDLVTDMKGAGFDLLYAFNRDATGNIVYSGNTAPSHSESTGYYVLAPTNVVDPLAVEDGDDIDPNYAARQPWRIVFSVIDKDSGGVTQSYIRVWVVPATQIIVDPSGEVRVAQYQEDRFSGYLFDDNSLIGTSEQSFFTRIEQQTDERWWSCYSSSGGSTTDNKAVPLSYLVSVTDHGIAFSMWAEGFDKAGDCFNWFCVQRLVKDDNSILIEGKAPLICTFTRDGGGNPDSGVLDAKGIQYFVVCESDIHAPTVPISAVAPTPDSVPFINSMQQVSHMENRNFAMQFPKGINTQRYFYPYKMDMVAYTSADVMSHNSLQTITVNAEQRQFKALNANSMNNTGMRPMFLVKGSGIA